MMWLPVPLAEEQKPKTPPRSTPPKQMSLYCSWCCLFRHLKTDSCFVAHTQLCSTLWIWFVFDDDDNPFWGACSSPSAVIFDLCLSFNVASVRDTASCVAQRTSVVGTCKRSIRCWFRECLICFCNCVLLREYSIITWSCSFNCGDAKSWSRL